MSRSVLDWRTAEPGSRLVLTHFAFAVLEPFVCEQAHQLKRQVGMLVYSLPGEL